MNSQQVFIYKTFYKYYESIIEQNNNNLNYYYYNTINNKSVLQSATLPKQYIIYNNIKIYIYFLKNDDMLFIIPRKNKNNILLGDHFHIGPIIKPQKNISRSIINKDQIFLHWSLQDDIKHERNMFTKCTIRNNIENLDDIDNILCTNRKNKTFIEEFNRTYNTQINPNYNPILLGLSPNDLNLLAIIKNILRRPFYSLQNAGNTIYIGMRGGKYIIKNNKKKYI